jgi:hypothetical protein
VPTNKCSVRIYDAARLDRRETADIRLVKYSGEISHNRVQFTHCRVFGAESNIDFNASVSVDQTPGFGVASLDDTLRPQPGGLQIAVKLRNRISGDMAVGTLIDGAVAGDVVAKHAVVIPSSSPVRGRIRRMERYTDPFPYFVVGLEFTEVEVQGIRQLFYADLVEINPALGAELILKNTTRTQTNPLLLGNISTRQTTETLSLYNLPRVATFFYKGGKLDLPRDFRTVWRTHSLRP